MQNIEINTTQNVRITYEVAHLGDRTLAFLIDLLIIGAVFLGSSFISMIFTDDSSSWVFYLISAPIAMFYTFAFEVAMKGQTPGKRALKIQVVKINGKYAQAGDYFLRWLFRLVDIYLSLGIVAAIFISTSKKGQRLGDLVSETSLIRIKPSSEMAFKEIEENYDNEDYVPVYPTVTKLSESDMLLVQNALIRYKKYKNDAHKQVLDDLSKGIREKLGIEDDASSPEPTVFLSDLIRDYIILTR